VPESYPFNTYSGLLTPEHYSKIGNAIWLFLWCISSTTTEKEKDGVVWGIVKGNKPHKLHELAEIFDVNEKTVRRWIDTLEKNGYIKITRAPYGLIFTVKNSKRGYIERVDKNVQSQIRERTKMSNHSERVDKNVQSRVDRSVQSNKDIIKDLNTTTITTKENDPVDLVAERYIDLRTAQEGKVVYPTTKDYEAIAQIIARAVPPVQIIKLLEQCFDEYSKRNPNGSIKAFSYCEKYILDHYEAIKARDEAKKNIAKRRIPEDGKNNRRGTGRVTKKDPGNAESITGGQVGWIGRKKVPVSEVQGSDGIY